MKKHYVYCLFRPTGEPFYIGMGQGDRIDHHMHRRSKGRSHKESLIRKIVAETGDLPRRKLAEGLSSREAANLERKLIAELGRYPDGPLLNATDGGEGPHNLTADALAARNAKISATKLAAWDAIGRKPPKLRADPEETRRKRSEAAKAARRDPEKFERIETARRAAFESAAAREKMAQASRSRWDALPEDEKERRRAQLRNAADMTREASNEKRRAFMRHFLADPERRANWREVGKRAAAARWSKRGADQEVS